MEINFKIILVCAVLFISLCIGLIPLLGLPSYASIISELLIYLLLIFSLLSRNGRRLHWPHLLLCFFSMLLITVCSMALNGTEIHRAIFSLRLLFRFYIFYLAITFLELSDKDCKIINAFVAFLLLVNLPVVAIKLVSHGINETTSGLYTTGDGSLTTYIPITVIFFSASYYLLYQKHFKYIFTTIGFVFIAIAGGKRAVLFLFPIQFFIIYHFFYLKNQKVSFVSKIAGFLIVCFSIVIIASLIIHYNKTLNPEGAVGGSIDLEYVLEYSNDYLSGVNAYGYSYGRTTTTIRVIESLFGAGPMRFLFGFGPGNQTPSFFDTKKDKKNLKEIFDEIQVSYGLTAFTKIAFEYGLLGVVTYLIILSNLARMTVKYFKLEKDPYWKAFAAGSIGLSFSLIFFYFTYNTSSIWGDAFPTLFFYVMAVVYTRINRVSYILDKQSYNCSGKQAQLLIPKSIKSLN